MTDQFLLKQIEKYDSIVLYRHTDPDVDACGSQFGLKNWLNENYPNKKVYALGDEICTQRPFPTNDKVSLETVKQSLAIVLDTANEPRVDDSSYKQANYVIKIDHHPNREPFGDYQIVIEKAAATCEILTFLLTSYPNKILSKQTAEYLYSGLLTDTLCFRTTNTTADSIEAGSILARTGLEIAKINRILFDQSLEDFAFASYIRGNAVMMNNKLAYLMITKDIMDKFHINDKHARSFIDELGHIKEIQSWMLFTEEDGENGSVYSASLRSKEAQVNDIAQKYGGGGHFNAAGAKNLTEQDVHDMILMIYERLH